MGAVGLGRPVESREELIVRKVIEDVVDAGVGFGRQVAVDSLVQQVPALRQHTRHDPAVKGEVYLVEADSCHGQGMHLLAKTLHHHQLLRVELPIAVEHAQLHDYLDEIFDDLLGLFAVVGVLLGGPVELIQDLAAGVINEDVGYGLGSHLAQELLLGLQGQVLGAEGVHLCRGKRHTHSSAYALDQSPSPLLPTQPFGRRKSISGQRQDQEELLGARAGKS